MTSKNNQSIENRPLVISIISMIGMVTAVATGAFFLGQYQARIDNRLNQTDNRVERLESMAEAAERRLNEGDVLSAEISTKMANIESLLEDIQRRLP